MNIFTFIMILLIGAIFFVTLRMYISASEVEERKLWIARIVLIVILLGLSWSTDKADSNSTSFLMIILIFSFPAPKLIAWFINVYRMDGNQPIFQLPLSKSAIVKELFSIVFYLFLAILVFIPNTYTFTTTPDGASTITHPFMFTVSHIAFAFFALSFISMSILNIVQRVRIFDEGLFYDGRLWKWTDFKSFHSMKGSKEVVLTTNSSRGLWQIKLGLLPENAENFTFLLAQNIKTASES